MSIGALGTSIMGLNASQRQLETIALNVANASTPGYTRKILNQSTTTLNGIGSGVQVGDLERNVNTSLLKDLWRQESRAGYSDTGVSYLQRVQQLMGTPDSQQSFAAALSDLRSSFSELASDPAGPVLQTKVLGRAEDFVSKMHNMSTGIQNLRDNAEDQILDAVQQINQLASQIADTNLGIVSALNREQNPVDLMDQREEYIRKLSEYINITTFTAGDGSVVVQTGNGAVLADTLPHTMSFETAPMSYNSVYPTSLNGVELDGTDITSQLTSGSLARLITLRDTELPKAQAMLDEVAHKTALRFAAQDLELFTLSDGTIPTNVVANYVGFSATFQVNSAVSADPSLLQVGTEGGTLEAGDNSLVLNVIDYTFGDYADASNTAHAAFRIASLGAGGDLDMTLPTSGTLIGFANAVVSLQAQQYNQTTQAQTYEMGYRDTLAKKLQDESGVSIDAEMTAMISIQKAYSASARTISVVGEMFDDLINAI